MELKIRRARAAKSHADDGTPLQAARRPRARPQAARLRASENARRPPRVGAGVNAKGWIAVELDGNANEEGKAYERKSLRWAQFAPGQDSILAAAPPDASAEPPPPPPRAGDNRSRRSGHAVRGAHRPP